MKPLLLMIALVVAAPTTTMALNSTEIETLKECNSWINDPIGNDELIDVNMSGLSDRAYWLGYCIGLNMREGYTDAGTTIGSGTG